MRRNALITLIVLILISGCSRIPKMDTEDIEKVQDITVNEATATNLEFNRDNWWTIYGDKELDKLMDIVLKSNLDLDIALINIEKSKEGVKGIRGSKMPTAELEGSAKRNKIEKSNSDTLEGQRTDTYNGEFLVRYDLDLFNKIDSLEKSQEFMVKGNELQRDLVKLQVTTLTTQLYGYYIYLEKINENLEARLDLLREIREMVEKGVEAGQNIPNDLLQVDNMINDTRSGIEENTYNQKKTVESLNLLSDYSSSQEIGKILGEAKTGSNILASELTVPEKIASTVVSNRPDVRYYLMVIQSQKYKMKSIQADYYPQFSITGSLGGTRKEFRTGFSPSTLAWELGPEVYLPIFNMSQLDSEYRVAGLELNEFVKEYDKTLKTAFKDINVELAANKASQRTLELSGENYKNLNKILKDKETELSLGAASKYDVLLKKYDELEARYTKEESGYILYKEQVALINSLGGVYKKTGAGKVKNEGKEN